VPTFYLSAYPVQCEDDWRWQVCCQQLPRTVVACTEVYLFVPTTMITLGSTQAKARICRKPFRPQSDANVARIVSRFCNTLNHKQTALECRKKTQCVRYPNPWLWACLELTVIVPIGWSTWPVSRYANQRLITSIILNIFYRHSFPWV
jgi:hypothetical protein